jgi:hypothetical protein
MKEKCTRVIDAEHGALRYFVAEERMIKRGVITSNLLTQLGSSQGALHLINRVELESGATRSPSADPIARMQQPPHFSPSLGCREYMYGDW